MSLFVPFRRLALFALAALTVGVGPAAAGPCQDQIARLEARLARIPGSAAAGPTLPESVGAKLGHQPTAESVQRAEAEAHARVTDILARAKALDARGDRAGCMRALAETRASVDF